MPGAPSRDTFDTAKFYRRVLFVGGDGRRLFDAELNEAQSILEEAIAQLASAIAEVDANGGQTGHKLGNSGRVTPSGSDFTVLIERGYLLAGNFVVRTGQPGTTFEHTVFNGGDATNREAVIYYDVFISTVDGTGDSEIIDPTYTVETAHRHKLNVSLTVLKDAVDPPAPSAGHVHIKLASCVNAQATLVATNITNADSILGLAPIALASQFKNDGNKSGSISVSFATGNIRRIRLTGNVIATAFTGLDIRRPVYILRLLQDNVGNRTFSWPSNVRHSSGIAPALTPTADREDIIALLYDGSVLTTSVINTNIQLT